MALTVVTFAIHINAHPIATTTKGSKIKRTATTPMALNAKCDAQISGGATAKTISSVRRRYRIAANYKRETATKKAMIIATSKMIPTLVGIAAFFVDLLCKLFNVKPTSAVTIPAPIT